MTTPESEHCIEPDNFQSLFSEQQRARLPSVKKFGIRTWLPGAHISVPPVAGVARIWVVLDGILDCEVTHHHTKVLPREILSADGNATFHARNASHSDAVSVIEIELKKVDEYADYAFDHRYYSDDQKDNKLCRFSGVGRVRNDVPPRTTAEIFFSDLNRYDSVILENDKAMAAIVLRGSATLGGIDFDALQESYVSDESPLIVTGVKPCETLLIRELGGTAP